MGGGGGEGDKAEVERGDEVGRGREEDKVRRIKEERGDDVGGEGEERRIR